MKKRVLFLVSMVMLLTVTSCTSANGDSDSQIRSSTIKNEENLVGSSDIQESIPLEQPISEIDYGQIEGLILPDSETDYPKDKNILGTQQDLDDWEANFHDTLPMILYLHIVNEYTIPDEYNKDIKDNIPLTENQVRSIINWMDNSPIAVFPEWVNPATGGGSYEVTALDDSKDILWDVYYDGYWFRLVKDDSLYIFSGESADIHNLEAILSE